MSASILFFVRNFMLILCFSPFYYACFTSCALSLTQDIKETRKVVKRERRCLLPGLLDKEPKGQVTLREMHRAIMNLSFLNLRTQSSFSIERRTNILEKVLLCQEVDGVMREKQWSRIRFSRPRWLVGARAQHWGSTQSTDH